MNHSFFETSLQTERFFDEQSNAGQRKVKIYFRAVTRKSIKIELPAQIPIEKLHEIVYNKFSIPYHNQVLYLKGTHINHSKSVLLENSWIIHVINLAQVQLQQIFITINASNLNNQMKPLKTTLSSAITLDDLFENYIFPEYSVTSQQILLVESGRFLKRNLTLAQQNVQNGTTISLIYAKKDQSSQSSFNLPSKSQIKMTQKVSFIQNDSSQKSQIDAISINKTVKNEWKGLSIKKSKDTICQVHDKQMSLHKDYSQKIFSRQDSLKTIDRQLHNCSHVKNITIQIGERECNCKKDKPVFAESSQARIITMEDKKRLSKEIREENLQKLIRNKQKKEEEIHIAPLTERKPLKKMHSMAEFKVNSMTERKKQVKLGLNPQKMQKKSIFA